MGTQRLKSRRPFVPAAQKLLKTSRDSNIRAANWAAHAWSNEWSEKNTRLHAGFVPTACTELTGVTLRRYALVKFNRLRTGVGRFRFDMHKWGLMASSATCGCSASEQTAYHIIHHSPLAKKQKANVTRRSDETLGRLSVGCYSWYITYSCPRIVLAGIQPAELRRRGATLSLACRAQDPNHLLHEKLSFPVGTQRLKSRRPFVPAAQELLQSSRDCNIRAAHWADHAWSNEWSKKNTRLHAFVPTTSTEPSGVTLRRNAWVKLNRLRTGVGRFRSDMHKWGLASSAACECGAAEQTADHVIRYCPLNRAPTGINGLRNLDENTTTWLLNSCPDI